uniref:Uncharacterized protein n=1 Tax=Phakopsora pachyrhizi TaxID=170000 RepID=A0A0S1MJX2_PHAPC
MLEHTYGGYPSTACLGSCTPRTLSLPDQSQFRMRMHRQRWSIRRLSCA